MKPGLFLLLLLSLSLALSCGNNELANRLPQAELSLPPCVLAGSLVVLDGSLSADPDGEIVRYVFTMDHGLPKLVHNQSQVDYRFPKAKISKGMLEQYVVGLTVIDDDGFEAYDQAALYVVNDLEQCPVVVEPEPDVIQEPEDVLADSQGEDVEPTPDIVNPPETYVDVSPKPDTTGYCPDLTGNYRVQVFCFGSVHVEMELTIIQNDCAFHDDFDLVSGTVDEDGNVELHSTYQELNINDCEGPLTDPTNFALECSSNCTAVFIKM